MFGKTNLKTSVIIAVFLVGIHCTIAAGGTIYVDVTRNGNGSSWANAYRYLQDALAAATDGNDIWVAAGIYKPDQDEAGYVTPGDRFATFQLINGVIIKGGYAGYGEPDPDKRDIETYETILSGDLNGNDVDVDDPCDLLAEPTRSENSYHVVTGSDVDETAVLHGFTVTAGNANGSFADYTGAGGGMLNYVNYNDCKPTVTECTFICNSALELGGGGMFNYGHGDGECNPILTDCTFIGNASAMVGGGICNWESSPVLADCTFTGNFAQFMGGGMGNSSFGTPGRTNPTLMNCIFTGNSTAGGGGGMCNWEFSSPTLANCSFSANSAANEGGGIYNELSDPTLTNCILWHNTDAGGTDESAQIHNYASSTPVINNTCIQGWTGALGGTGNHGDDPLFVDANGADDIPGTVDDNLRLMEGSPCIDAGSNNEPNLPEMDMDGHARIIDGDCNDTDIVDMGAYEFNYAYMGDFDYNCEVDFSDFAMFALAWLTQPADAEWNRFCDISLPADNSIDWRDLDVFADNWLAGVSN